MEEREKGERRRRRRREIRSEEAIDERFWFWLQSLLCVKTELEMLVYLVNFFLAGRIVHVAEWGWCLWYGGVVRQLLCNDGNAPGGFFQL